MDLHVRRENLRRLAFRIAKRRKFRTHEDPLFLSINLIVPLLVWEVRLFEYASDRPLTTVQIVLFASFAPDELLYHFLPELDATTQVTVAIWVPKGKL